MKKFKVLTGIHVEGEQEYKAGDVVVSARPLATMFFNKFEDLGPAQEDPLPTPAAPPEDDEDEWEKEEQEPPKAKAKRKAPAPSRFK